MAMLGLVIIGTVGSETKVNWTVASAVAAPSIAETRTLELSSDTAIPAYTSEHLLPDAPQVHGLGLSNRVRNGDGSLIESHDLWSESYRQRATAPRS